MANKKVTQLPENKTPTDDDLLYMVDSPSGEAASQSVSIENVIGLVPDAEPPLGDPAADDYILSSTADGVRSWIPDIGALGDAPEDGSQYGRQDADWTEITPASVGADPSGSADAVEGNLDAHTAQTTLAHGGIVADTDSRLSDARVPTVHATTHATLGADPLTATDIGADVAGSAQGVQDNLTTHVSDISNPHSVTAAQTGADPSGSADAVQVNLTAHEGQTTTAHGGIVADSDSRLTDARAPTAHASTHATGQSDAIAAADIGAEPDLGNPATDGFVLSSTIAGIRTWIEMAASGGGDVEEAPEDGTPYSRQSGGWVAALRTGVYNAWSALQQFNGGIVTPFIAAVTDSTSAFTIRNSTASTTVLQVDTVTPGVTVTGNFQVTNGHILLAANNTPIYLGDSTLTPRRMILLSATDDYYNGPVDTGWGGNHYIKAGVGISFLTNAKISQETAGWIDENQNWSIGAAHLPTAVADIGASTTAAASLRLRDGVAPTTPNNGDIWQDGTDLLIRIGGTTYTLDKTAV